ncbi:hypothetical protein B0H16DRAFT_1527276, partial [Mycena metata]
FTPSARPALIHSFVTMSTDAVSAVMDERSSDKVFLTLENRRSTEMLYGTYTISRATRLICLKVPWLFWFERQNYARQESSN